MKLKPIINSLLVQDFYKYNMASIVCDKFNDYTTTWAFKCRNEDVKFTPEMIAEIREQIDHICTLRYTDEELKWLKSVAPWLSSGFINFLKYWHPDRSEIKINEGTIRAYNDCGLAIECEGTWLSTMQYEIPILAIVNEVYFAFNYGEGAYETEFIENTIEKFGKIFSQEECDNASHPYPYGIDGVTDVSLWNEYHKTHPYNFGTFSEFGLRRRYSAKMQDWLIKYITDKKIPGFAGTSNVYLAKKYGVKPIGTQAHEFFMAFQSIPWLDKSYTNWYGMKVWTDYYGTNLGIALTDTTTTEIFLKDFDSRFATLFSGLRHDSGDPIEWGETVIEHYKKLGIDTMTKTLLFSDGLDFQKATDIRKHFDGKCKVAFGIGTNLSNPLTSVKPLNIVHKMVKCNGYDVAKLSNCKGKVMSRNEDYINYLQRCIDWRLRFGK